jgi:hypothetical protein
MEIRSKVIDGGFTVLALVVVLGPTSPIRPIGLMRLMGLMCPKHEKNEWDNLLFEQRADICGSNQLYRNVDFPVSWIAIFYLVALHQGGS